MNVPQEKEKLNSTLSKKEEWLEKIKLAQEELVHLRHTHALSPLGNTSLLKKKKKEIARAYTKFHNASS